MARGHIKHQGENSYLVAVPIPHAVTKSGHQKYSYETVKRSPGMTQTEFRQAADDRCAAMVRRLYRGDFVESPTRLTTGEHLRTWLARRMADPDLRPRTKRGYRLHIEKHLAPYFDKIPLLKLTADHCEDYKAHALQYGRHPKASIQTGKGLSPRTVHAHFRTLRAALNYAVAECLILKSPLASRENRSGAKPPRVSRRRGTIFTVGEAQVLLAVVKKYNLFHYYVWLTALLTGMRLGEILALRWQDIDFKKKSIDIQHSLEEDKTLGDVKTDGSAETLPMVEMLARELQEHKRGQGENPLNLVFPARTGQPLGGPLVHKWLRHDLDVAGLPRIRVHDLRHTAGTLLLELGVDLKTVSQILRHTNIQTTGDLYLHPRIQRGSLEKLEETLKNDQKDQPL